MDNNRRQTVLAWMFISTLVVLLAVLGVLQYKWTSEVSVAERTRIHETLEVGLRRLSQSFNAEATAVATALTADVSELEGPALEAEFAKRYEHLANGSYAHWLKGISIVTGGSGESTGLRQITPNGRFVSVDWPASWKGIQQRVEGHNGPREDGPFSPFGGGDTASDPPNIVAIPDFHGRGGGVRGSTGFSQRPEMRWVLLEYDLDYLTGTVLPKLLNLHLGTTEIQNYHAVMVQRGKREHILYRSDPGRTGLTIKPDATVRLFDVHVEPAFRRRLGGPGFTPGQRSGPPRPDFRRKDDFARDGDGRRPPTDSPIADRGRWELLIQHRVGSLEILVAQARRRNLAVIGGILALILAAGWALLRFTRRAQRLAELQMQFVASVTHELRTPLAVMRTAGHNLQGKVAADPARVKQYGALIQQESQKLGDIVEQVLRFANSNAGRVINSRETVPMAELIAAAVKGSQQELDASGCVIETAIADDLPPVNVDRATVQHALQNLVANAAKYGKSGQWIGISAALYVNGRGPEVEIRVKDKGPGIPPSELGHIFDPFYRGTKAINDQIHGTGLGLTLSRRIIEAHGGTITATSEPGGGTEFTVLLPVNEEAEENHATNSIS